MNTKDINKRPLDTIINKVLDGQATEEEATSVIHWFASSEGQEYLSKKMDKDLFYIQENLEEVSKNYNIPTEKILKEIEKQLTRQKIRKILYSAAAILIPMILITGLYYQVDKKVDLFGNSEYVELYVPKGERLHMMFQDGSKVFLNSDTRIKYPKQFGISNRKISLEGEGYFDVAPNPQRPFIIELEKASIKVLGTSFNVKSYSEEQEVEVSLDEGKIDFIAWTQEHNILNENEIAVLDKETGKCSISCIKNAKQKTLWKSNVISFDQEPLIDVIIKLNRWYNVEFEVTDEEAYKYSYTLTSPNTLLEYLLQDLEKVSPLQFTLQKGVVYVKVRK